MNILVIGSGGREHAIIQKIIENKNVKNIYAIPGNGGIKEAINVNIDSMDNEKIVEFAKNNNIDFCVVTPDDPLANGLVDCLEAANIACFGPTKKAAQIEASKLFAKELMDKYNIPTAKWKEFSDSKKAIEYLNECNLPIVIKADGLAKGKGVIIANSYQEAKTVIEDILNNKIFGESGNTLIIEEFLQGQEVSVLCLVDGLNVVPMLSAMDHKRALDNDEGLNTGGMGVICPNPYYTDSIAEECYNKIFLPTAKAMIDENNYFKGCLFFGIMLTNNGAKVLEYNARFGDPETQAVLSLFNGDLLECLMAVRNSTLTKDMVSFQKGSACCVVAASKGYPEQFEKNKVINIDSSIDAIVNMAGVKLQNNQLLTNGGRVLSVTAKAENLQLAINKAYNEIKKVSFENIFYRNDIGAKALKYGRE